MKELIEQLRAGIDLTPSEIRVAANFLADTGSPDEEKTAFLAALRDKGESGDEVGYFAEAFLNLAVTPSANLNGKPSIDLCGTGGDRLELINVDWGTVGRLVLEPGWRWSEDVKPIAGTEWCEAPHFQYHVSGVFHLVMSDGTEFDARPGEVTRLPAGHDAYVVGNEPVVVLDFFGATQYAKT